MKIVATVALLLISAVAALAAGQDDERPGVTFKVETSLEDGVKAFNERIQEIATDESQQPLTEDEVVAAIRGWLPERQPVKPEILEVYHSIAENRKLPAGSSIDLIRKWSGYKGFNFEVWWVDVGVGPVDRTQKDPVLGHGYSFRIRDQKIRSWPMSDEERLLEGVPK